MAHGLVVAAHHAEHQLHAAILRGHAGDDGVQGPFAGPDAIGVALRQFKALAPVVQQHA